MLGIAIVIGAFLLCRVILMASEAIADSSVDPVRSAIVATAGFGACGLVVIGAFALLLA